MAIDTTDTSASAGTAGATGLATKVKADFASAYAPPAPLPSEPPVDLPPDSLGYRLKRRLLGHPLNTDQLEHERLGKPTALAVFASDNLSSSAYATEEILHVLVPAIGLAAFSLVVPVTIAMLVVLGFLILSYRETIKAYPTAGGAYVVTRDNFGIVPAQVAGVALLTDYILTVAVSVAAGSAALGSAFPGLAPYAVPFSIAFILLIAFGNLRGVRESGKVFAVPTYFFIANMAVLLALGMFRLLGGDLPLADHDAEGLLEFGDAGDGLLLGASFFVVLRAFASGGAAVTGVEAISNGVPAFRKPAWRHARQTLVVMGSLLGLMFLGLSVLASHMEVSPFHDGTPTVISQIGDLIYGESALGHLLYFSLQAGTMLILVLAANTSFADFPRLASFQAGDSFMPRQLTKRGHRLVFSNGIIFLAGAAILLVIVTGAQVSQLIPLYAVGVFTSFTLSQAGMARHHLRLREPNWKRGLVINGVGAVLSLVVDVVIAVTKFSQGAWVIILLIPIMVVFLLRLSRQYETEAEQLEQDVPLAMTAPILRRHVVLVFVDKLDLAAARAIQYARTLTPDDLRAVHFALDPHYAEELTAAWTEAGMSRIPLDIVDCPDRRLTRAAVDVVARDLADGETEVSVLLPDRKYKGFWNRILHDQTAEAIERDVSQLPHVNVTTVPFHFGPRREARTGFGLREAAGTAAAAVNTAAATGHHDADADGVGGVAVATAAVGANGQHGGDRAGGGAVAAASGGQPSGRWTDGAGAGAEAGAEAVVDASTGAKAGSRSGTEIAAAGVDAAASGGQPGRTDPPSEEAGPAPVPVPGQRTTGQALPLTPIGDVRWRQRVTVQGRVQTLRVKPLSGSTTLECVIEDGTGAMSLVFTGRSKLAGIECGTRIRAQGTAAEHRGRLAIFNPLYTLIVDRS